MKMLVKPNKKKNLKLHKGKFLIGQYSYNKIFIHFGHFGLKVKESGRITPKQLEAVRRFLVRSMGRQGLIWFFIFPDISITKKPQEVRMGKGKGAIYLWVAKIYCGNILVEVAAPNNITMFKILQITKKKIPVLTNIIGNVASL
jgi:large subunit ribosomal protein L16